MNDEGQLPLIKEFMLRVSPEVLRHRYNLIRESESPYSVIFDPEKIAENTLQISMHLAAAYARCYNQLQSEANQTAPSQPETSQPANHLRQAAANVPQ